MKPGTPMQNHNNTVPPAIPMTETHAPDTTVMPTERPRAIIPTDVSVMPISAERPRSSFFEELQSVLFGARVKMDTPKESVPHNTPVAASTVKKVSVLSVGLFALLTGSAALSPIATGEVRADDTRMVRQIQQADSPGTKAFLARREKVRDKMDVSVNREVDNLTHDGFTAKWSFVAITLDAKGLTDEREQAILCPHGYVYRYEPQTRTARVALPTRYLVTVANMSFVRQMAMDTEHRGF